MTANVRQDEHGRLILDDRDAAGMQRAVGRENCRRFAVANAERIQHFQGRAAEFELTPTDVVITIINVDDPNGAAMAEALMPSHDWQQYRDRGEMPVARGLAARAGVLDFVRSVCDVEEQEIAAVTGLAVVVVHDGTAGVFSIDACLAAS